MKGQFTVVAFFAYLGSNLRITSLTKHKVIVFNVVDLNPGNGYNKDTGKFTFPSDGLYLFHVSIGVINRSHVVVELSLNGDIKTLDGQILYILLISAITLVPLIVLCMNRIQEVTSKRVCNISLSPNVK